MFLVTPEFTVRMVDVIKLVPRTGMNKEQYGHESGTIVYINNVMGGRVDREFTSLLYSDVLQLLSNYERTHM